MNKLNVGVNETNIRPEVGKQKPKNFKERLTNLFSFGGNKDKKSDVPPPGTPPTFNDDGSIADPGNPYIGPIDPKLGYAPVGYSGTELRRIKRAQQRREAAQQRVGQRAYDRQQKALRRANALEQQRLRVLNGEVAVTDSLYDNIVREAERLVAAPDDHQMKQQRAAKAEKAKGRLEDRREARFRAGKPRGKDLREDIYNEYESLLPDSARNRSAAGGDK